MTIDIEVDVDWQYHNWIDAPFSWQNVKTIQTAKMESSFGNKTKALKLVESDYKTMVDKHK